MAIDPWLSEFRVLHERAGKGSLNDEEQKVYLTAREQLARTLSKVQGLNLRPQDTARQAFRVALMMPLELELKDGTIRAVTLDVGRGGFSSILQHLPEMQGTIGFSLKLPGGAAPLVGRVRMVDNRKQVGNFRVSFAFTDLGEADVDRVERALFDSVLTRLGV